MLDSGNSERLAGRAIRVVVADDSAVVRNILARLFTLPEVGDAAQRIELCAAVPDGESCIHVVRALRPDVVVLDFDMPGLSGLDVILQLRQQWPNLPIIMFSTHTARGARVTLDALACGASDYVTKPTGQRDITAALASLREQLLPRIVALAQRRDAPPRPVENSSTVVSGKPSSSAQVVGIGLSTGGPAALEILLPRLPGDFPAPVLIVQHMPKLFTNALASRLERLCSLRVRLGEHGAEVHPGTIWLAPGDLHMEVVAGVTGTPRIVLNENAPVNHCRPSVDPLFCSLARVYGSRAIGVVMTGMGSDGLEGAHALVRAGAAVLAQDEASSAVWGMPGRVANAGLASVVLPVEGIAEQLIMRTTYRERALVQPITDGSLMRARSHAGF